MAEEEKKRRGKKDDGSGIKSVCFKLCESERRKKKKTIKRSNW